MAVPLFTPADLARTNPHRERYRFVIVFLFYVVLVSTYFVYFGYYYLQRFATLRATARQNPRSARSGW